MKARKAWWRPVAAVAVRETRGLVRERTVLVAVLVQLLVAGFSAFLAVGLLGLYDPDAVAGRAAADIGYVAVPDEGGGTGRSTTFEDVLRAERNLRVQRLGSVEAVEQLRQGRLEAVVEEAIGGDGSRAVTLLVPEGDLQGVLLVTQLRALLQDYELRLRQENQDRLEEQVLDVEGPGGGTVPYPFVYGTLLPILVLTPVFLSGAIAADAVVAELQRKTLGLLRSSPATLAQVLAGKLLPPLALAPAQVLLWCALLGLNGVPVAMVGAVLGITLAWTALLCGVGVAAAAGLQRQGTAQAAYALLAITVAPLAVLLPRDPFNLVALLGAGRMDAAGWWTFAAWALLGTAALLAGARWSAAKLRQA